MNSGVESSPITTPSTIIPFSPAALFKQGGSARKLVLYWLVACIFIIPSSVITRYLEWTGIPLSIGGVDFFITVYIPMLLCVPLVFWMGYFWAAIPAYLSTFLVAYVGGMPLSWAFLFSFSNPLSLAFYYLSLSIVPIYGRDNMLISIVSFVLISLVASLAGSTGSFIWAYANQVGLNDALPVWQGWWVGGWLQAVALVLPVLYLVGPIVNHRLNKIYQSNKIRPFTSYRILTFATIAFVAVLIGYVVTARFIGGRQLEQLKDHLSKPEHLNTIDNAINGMSYPLYILLAVMVALIYLTYKAIVYWSQASQNANRLLKQKNIELERLAMTDSLTQLLVRRAIMQIAEAEFERTKRDDLDVSILMIDIDKFKRINDVYGHLVGDAVIRFVANVVSESLRPYDAAGRYGGEEFIVMLPNTGLSEALTVANRIRTAVENTHVPTEKGLLPVTASIGVASLGDEDGNLTCLIERADQALLNAKNSGRNCVHS
jgi:diguanylate cyclase (GGDEF)-like protein